MISRGGFQKQKEPESHRITNFSYTSKRRGDVGFRDRELCESLAGGKYRDAYTNLRLLPQEDSIIFDEFIALNETKKPQINIKILHLLNINKV